MRYKISPTVHWSLLASGCRLLSPMLAVSLSSFLVSGAAYAADDAVAQPTPADQPSKGLEEIVVTAQRRTQTNQQVPISVQSVSSNDVARIGGVSTTDLVQLSPSVSFRVGNTPSTSAFAIRGVSSTSIEGGIQPSVAVVIDGMPTYLQGEAVFELDDLKNIEVLRGPQGTLFGKNSTAGVINIVNNAPTANLGGKIDAGLTNDSEYWVNGVLNIPISDKIQSRFSAYYRDQQPLVHNRGTGGDLLGAKSYGVRGQLKFELSQDLDLLVTAAHWQTRSSYSALFVITPNPGAEGVLQREITGINYGYGNLDSNTNSPTNGHSNSTSVIAQLDWRPTEKVTITSITGWRTFYSDGNNDIDATPLGSTVGSPIVPNPLNYPSVYLSDGTPHTPNRTKYGSEELRFHYENGPVDFVAGGFYQTAQVRSRNTFDLALDGSLVGATPGVPFFVGSSLSYQLHNDAGALFGDLNYKILSGVTVFGGLRYTHETLTDDYSRINYFTLLANYDSLTGAVNSSGTLTQFAAADSLNNLSGRAGLQWQPSAGQNYYASYNRGYKGPAAATGASASGVNSIIKPEIANAFEIGTKQRMFDNRVSLSLALFDQVIDNIQQSALIAGTVTTALVNAGNLTSKGVEFEGHWLLTPSLELSAGVSYVDAYYSGTGGETGCYAGETALTGCINGAEQLAGKRVANVPKFSYNTSIYYSYPIAALGKVEANVSWNWISSVQYGVDQNPLTLAPGYGLLNGSIALVADRGWELRVFGRNLTNKFYYGLIASTPGIIATQYAYMARDFKRYGGLELKYTF